MKYEIFTPFHDDPTINHECIRYLNISDGRINVIIRNFNWDFLEIISTDYTRYDSEDSEIEYYALNSGTWTVIEEENEPVWEALEGNLIDPAEWKELEKERADNVFFLRSFGNEEDDD